MAPRKKDEKREQKKRARRLKMKRERQEFLGGDMVVFDPPGAVKMSAVLLEFIEPYADMWETEEELKKLLSLALIGWNAGLASGSKRTELVESVVATVPPEARAALRTTLAEMIHRKEKHYASNQRMILDFQLTMTPAGPHVYVISTLEAFPVGPRSAVAGLASLVAAPFRYVWTKLFGGS